MLVAGAGMGLMVVGTLVATQNLDMPLRLGVGVLVAYGLGYVIETLRAK